jgi:hypothetical protein
MGERFSSRLSFNLVVVDLKLGGKHFSQLEKISIHSTRRHDGLISHLHQFRLGSSNNAVPFGKPCITANDNEVLSSDCDNCTAVVYVWVELISSVFDV